MSHGAGSLGAVVCAWCSATAPSPFVAKVDGWIEREKQGEWLCPTCGQANICLEHRLVQLLAAYGCRYGVIPRVMFEGDNRANCRVSVDPSKPIALFLPDDRAESARRAFEDFTTIPPERTVLVRNGTTWKVEEKTGAVPDVARAVLIRL